MTEICKNCGYDEGLHKYDTMQCPKGGEETREGHRQEWLNTIFSPNLEDFRNEHYALILDMSNILNFFWKSRKKVLTKKRTIAILLVEVN